MIFVTVKIESSNRSHRFTEFIMMANLQARNLLSQDELERLLRTCLSAPLSSLPDDTRRIGIINHHFSRIAQRMDMLSIDMLDLLPPGEALYALATPALYALVSNRADGYFLKPENVDIGDFACLAWHASGDLYLVGPHKLGKRHLGVVGPEQTERLYTLIADRVEICRQDVSRQRPAA